MVLSMSLGDPAVVRIREWLLMSGSGAFVIEILADSTKGRQSKLAAVGALKVIYLRVRFLSPIFWASLLFTASLAGNHIQMNRTGK